MADNQESPLTPVEKIAHMDGQIEGLRVLLTQALAKTQDKQTLTEISKSLDLLLKEEATNPLASGAGTENPGVRSYRNGVRDILIHFRKVIRLLP